MKHYVENLFDFSEENSVPKFIQQTEEFTCPICHNSIRIPVPPTGVDWEKVAKDYERYAKQMWRDCNLLLSEAGVDTLLEKRLREILERCKRALF